MKSIPQNQKNENNIQFTINNFFSLFDISALLKKSNFYKSKGGSCLLIRKYLFSLIFTHKNLFRHLESKTLDFEKDTVYHFLNSAHYN